MQMDPGPTPILRPSAPALIRSTAAARVAMFPAMMSTLFVTGSFFNNLIMSMHMSLWPCAMSMTRTSAPACTNARARDRSSRFTPTAAPTRRRECWSRHAKGFAVSLRTSAAVMRKRSFPVVASTMGRLLTLPSCSSLRASSSVISGLCVTVSFSAGVMRSRTSASSVANCRSPIVSIPRKRSFGSSTTRERKALPLTPASMRRMATGFVASGPTEPGRWILKDCARLTADTMRHCSSTEQKRWRMPMPPSRAIATAMLDSHTVSMFDATMGMLSGMLRDRYVADDTSLRERTPERWGTSSTSSYVRPMRMSFSKILRDIITFFLSFLIRRNKVQKL
eukprot:PhM_4_TR7763/c2_g1_i1/m.70869